MAVLIKFDQSFGDRLKSDIRRGIQAATTFLQTQCKLAVNVSNPGQPVKVKRKRKGGNKRSRTIYPSPSAPGEPPRKRTGFGQRHIRKEFDPKAMVGRVGVAQNAIYMLYLEIGTRRVKRRPWLVSTFMKHRAMIGRLAMLNSRMGRGQ